MRTGSALALAEAPESKYEAIFNQASDAILAILPDGRIDAANHAAEEMTGYLRQELAGAAIDVLVPEPSKRLHRARPLTRELLSSPGTFEDIAILRKDGYVRFVDLNVRPVSSERHGLTIALFRDVTEKKSMERELITKHSELRNAYYQLEKKNAELQGMQEILVQSGKLAALGELAAGIAHELNQPLQGIRGYAQEIQSVVESGPEAAAALREIISNVDKMAGIIGYLRAFVRKSVEQYEWTDVHAAIEESLKMLSRQFAARGITVKRDFAGELPKIYANPLQLEQVFINLATNARDAIEAAGRGKGTISIITRFKGDFVEIDFGDDGCGMNERIKAKAFNPFFTTKEVGKGMGLGLSLSYGILSKLNGSIVVESELGKGAAFRIRIPRDFREMG
ncbi:MAG: PAS domain S-box protein [Oligoflexia bacterium]|nr:PAS domain S-box protein [Oligoflexia bacterium]